MLTIRQQQLDSLRQIPLGSFEDQLLPLLQRSFPRIANQLGEHGIRSVIQHGIDRASKYGIVRQKDVGRYIAVMMMLGPSFDQRITSGAISAALRDPRLRDSKARTDALCNAVLFALKRRTLRTQRKPHW